MIDEQPLPDGQGQAGPPVATTPLVVAGRTRGSGRWLVAGGLTVLLILAVAGFVVLAGQRTAGAPATAGYLPAGTLVYLDARLDLPGDQGQQVADFLSRFPGLADRAALPAKLDDVLTRLVRSASDGKVDYDSQIKPWFGGRVALALTSGPTTSGGQAPAEATSAGALALFSVSDVTAARSDLAAIASAAGATVGAPGTYRGATLETLTDGSGGGAVLGLSQDMLIVGPSAEAVKGALDVHSGQGASLAASGTFTDALTGLRADRLGTVYVDVPGLTAAAQRAAGGSPQASLLASLPQPLGAVAGELHAESDRLVASFRAAKGPDAPNLSARTSDLAQHVPAGAIVYLEAHDAGQLLSQSLGQLSAAAGQGSADDQQLQALDGYLGFLGGPDALVGWIKDAGAAVTWGADGQPQAGLVALATDADTAQARLKQWLGLLSLAGSSSGVSTTQEQASGVTITIIHLDAGSGGPAAGAGGAAALPTELAVAAKGDLIVVGLGDAFVKQVLALDPAGSLASSERFSAALAAAGGPRDSGLTWIDVNALDQHLAKVLPAGQRAEFEAQVKPYLDVIDHLIAVQSVDGSTFTGVVQLVTK
ncbi:MAG TPA: DUF3352 domain-containing protein [Candidatus Limnocylindrales bacterium]|nr:DUF3352 domain-containing protein [Candidatus Limnocylindrales bacterium]